MLVLVLQQEKVKSLVAAIEEKRNDLALILFPRQCGAFFATSTSTGFVRLG